MIKNTNLFLLLISCLICYSCIEELERDRPNPSEFIVVDGILNYHPSADSSDLVVYLNLSKTTSTRPVPLGDAVMELLVNEEIIVPFIEGEKGAYYLQNKEVFETGNSYKLLFQIGDNKYESFTEVLPDSVTIDKAYAELDIAGTEETAFEVFVDLEDPSNQENYYRWLITQWEKQPYCVFCYQEFRYPEVCQTSLHAPPDVNLSRNNVCDGDCFEILKFSPNNSIADVFIDGKLLIKKSLGYVPLNFSRPCLIEVKQSSLTKGYYDFLEKLRSQAEATGGLADTPAALLSANVKNINNPSEKIVGYFSVTNNSVHRFWLERSEAVNFNFRPLGRINPPLDPPIITPPEWAPLPCVPSKNRTPIKPWGWKD